MINSCADRQPTRQPFISVLTVGIGLYVVLSALSLTGSKALVYDEVYYVGETTAFFRENGLSRRFLSDYPYPAGLPNAIMLGLCEPFAGTMPPQVRFYNLALFAIAIGVCGILLNAAKCKDPWGGGVLALTNPIAWVLAGLALTEMLAATLSIAAMALVYETGRLKPPSSICIGIAAGAICGIAVLSRPQLIVLIPVLIPLACFRPAQGRLISVVTFVTGWLVVCGPVFAVWRGIVSPAVGRWNFEYHALSITNMLLASGYAGAMLFLVAPRWFQIKWGLMSYILGGLIAGLFIFNLFEGTVQIAPFRTWMERVLTPRLACYYPRLCGSALLGVALLFWANLGTRSLECRLSSPIVFIATLAMGITVLSTAKITHQFSSRYVAVAFPFIVVAAAPYRGSTMSQIVSLLFGGSLGAITLMSYFWR